MVRKLFGVVAAVALASGAMFALVGPASAGTIPTLSITVHKTISGTPGTDQTYQIQVLCSHNGTNLVVNPGSTQSITWNSATDTFSPSTANQTFSVETRAGGDSTIGIVCSVSETADGDATSHTIVCGSTTGTSTACNSTTDEVSIDYAQAGTANLTVTNNYSSTTTTTSTTIGPAVTTLPPATTTTLAPKPAPKPVVAAANFTG